MNERAASLVLASLAKLYPMAQDFDEMFNSRLLDTHPEIYQKFEMYLAPQERSVVRVLQPILNELGRFGAVLPTVRALMQTNKVYALVDANYRALAETLIWTLRRSLNAGFTAELERAWQDVLLDRSI